MFPDDRRNPAVAQALSLAEKREAGEEAEIPERNDVCQAYRCPVPDHYLWLLSISPLWDR